MFVQIIEGKARDAEAIQALGETWERDLQPGAVGYLGVTSGVTADNQAITIVRFDSPESARLNSERPEQTEFFQQMSALYDGAPTFRESTDTESFLGGIDTSAQFVQVMKTTDPITIKDGKLPPPPSPSPSTSPGTSPSPTGDMRRPGVGVMA